MARPLTSTDIIRERMGFGVSELAAPETRRAYAEAGLSPLGTKDRERLEEGRGISPMAGTQQREAFEQAEFMAGLRKEAPVSYGGLGERPEATTRRGFRRQQEWDARYKMMMEQEEASRQAEVAAREERRLSLAEQAEQRLQWAQDTKEQRDAAIMDQSGKIQSSIIGFTRPDGSKSRPININDEDAVERLQSVIYANRLGMEDQATKEVVTQMLNDAMDARQKMIETDLATRDAVAKEKVALAKDLGVYGMSIADFTENGVVNFEKANEAIGKAYAAGKAAEPEIAATKEQRSAIASKITDAEKKLLEIRSRVASAQKRVEARPTVRDFQTELESAQIEQRIFEDEINRLNSELGGEKPQTPASPQTTGQRPALGDIFGGQ